MIRTIYFDFGNVVAKFNHWRSIARMMRHTELSPEELYDALYDNDLEDAFEHGALSTDEYIAEAIRRGKLDLSPARFLEQFQDIFTGNADVINAIPKLAKTHRIVLASNTNDAHYSHYQKQFADVMKHFSALPASHLAKSRKPNPGFFEYCQQFAEAMPGECAFVDDLALNVEAAKRHGWHGIHYRPGDDLRAKLREAGIDY